MAACPGQVGAESAPGDSSQEYIPGVPCPVRATRFLDWYVRHLVIPGTNRKRQRASPGHRHGSGCELVQVVLASRRRGLVGGPYRQRRSDLHRHGDHAGRHRGDGSPLDVRNLYDGVHYLSDRVDYLLSVHDGRHPQGGYFRTVCALERCSYKDWALHRDPDWEGASSRPVKFIRGVTACGCRFPSCRFGGVRMGLI